MGHTSGGLAGMNHKAPRFLTAITAITGRPDRPPPPISSPQGAGRAPAMLPGWAGRDFGNAFLMPCPAMETAWAALPQEGHQQRRHLQWQQLQAPCSGDGMSFGVYFA